MSEIYNGTFLLGNTSATTLSAGPGIKIDSTSVPGTIKISNDETVLWSGWNNNSTDKIYLTESLSNFERVKLKTQEYERVFYNELGTEQPNLQYGNIWCFSNYTQYISHDYRMNEAKTEITWNGTNAAYLPNTATSTWNTACQLIEVRGINRISGGN